MPAGKPLACESNGPLGMTIPQRAVAFSGEGDAEASVGCPFLRSQLRPQARRESKSTQSRTSPFTGARPTRSAARKSKLTEATTSLIMSQQRAELRITERDDDKVHSANNSLRQPKQLSRGGQGP